MGEQAHIADLLRVYTAIAKRFELPAPPAQLQTGNPHPLAAEVYFGTADNALAAYQLRQYLQETPHQIEHDLAPLIKHYLKLSNRTEAQRQKLEVLLAFYLIGSPTSGSPRQTLENEKVAEILKPVLGEIECRCGHPTEPVNVLINIVQSLKELRDIKRERILDRSKQLKESFGEAFFCPASLVAFAALNFAVQRAFIRLRSADVRRVSESIAELEKLGVKNADCKQAGMSHEEPLAHLKQICNEWQHGTVGEYSSDRTLERIIGVRQALELALHRATKPHVVFPQGKTQPPAVPVVAATAAAAVAKPTVAAGAAATAPKPAAEASAPAPASIVVPATTPEAASAAASQPAPSKRPTPSAWPAPKAPIAPVIVVMHKKSGLSRIFGWKLWVGLAGEAVAFALTQATVISHVQNYAAYARPAAATVFVISSVLIGLSFTRSR